MLFNMLFSVLRANDGETFCLKFYVDTKTCMYVCAGIQLYIYCNIANKHFITLSIYIRKWKLS